MNEKQARKIVHFYLEITEDDSEILKNLIENKKAVRYFNLKQGEIIKKDWNITKLQENSKLYNNVTTDNTFEKYEEQIDSVDILIPIQNDSE